MAETQPFWTRRPSGGASSTRRRRPWGRTLEFELYSNTTYKYSNSGGPSDEDARLVFEYY